MPPTGKFHGNEALKHSQLLKNHKTSWSFYDSKKLVEVTYTIKRPNPKLSVPPGTATLNWIPLPPGWPTKVSCSAKMATIVSSGARKATRVLFSRRGLLPEDSSRSRNGTSQVYAIFQESRLKKPHVGLCSPIQDLGSGGKGFCWFSPLSCPCTTGTEEISIGP